MDYRQPQTVEEAVSLKKELDNAGFYAGGTCINQADFSGDYECLISLEKTGFDKIEKMDNTLKIGSMVRLQELIDSPLVLPVLKEASRWIYSRNVRNMATVGGNIGACWKHSSLIPCLTALKATVAVGQKEELTIEEYLKSDRTGLITGISIPLNERVCSVKRVRRSSGSKTVLSFALSMSISENGSFKEPVLAATGFGDEPRRLPMIEELIAKAGEPAVSELESAFGKFDELKDDVSGTKSYKTYISAQTVAACVAECKEVLA